MSRGSNGSVQNPFLREQKDGLVNLESYLPYLPDPPEDVPISLPFNYKGDWVHQHVYFQEATYRQEGIRSEKDKDMDLVKLRNISYNQVIMRPENELRLHQDHENNVKPPLSEIVAACLQDYDHIDIIGAAIVGKLISLKPETRMQIAPGGSRPAMSGELSPAERASFFESQLEASLDALKKPLITPDRIVTSALRRMSVLLNNRQLESESDARLKEDALYYPLRMPRTAKLYFISNNLIRHMCEVEEIEELVA